MESLPHPPMRLEKPKTILFLKGLATVSCESLCHVATQIPKHECPLHPQQGSIITPITY